METSPSDNVEANDDNQLPQTVVPAPANQGGLKSKEEFSEDEVRGALEVIASTGNFWSDWNHLRNLLSYKLKQVLSEYFSLSSYLVHSNMFFSSPLHVIYVKVISEYPEASMSDEQQIFSLGETIPELVNRLDNELHNFIDGAPFTLQRICEILLAAQNIYPKLSKLVLALEKNLLVSSTLAMCNGLPPSVMSNPGEPNSVKQEKESEAGSPQLVSEANGVEPAVEEVKDEIMTDAEEGEEGEADVNDDMTIDAETVDARTEANETLDARTEANETLDARTEANEIHIERIEATEILEARTEATNSIVNPNSNL
ncbi:unnamed protein product [Rhodiola kirilowii]